MLEQDIPVTTELFTHQDRSLYLTHMQDLVEHSDASIGEIEYLQQITDTDPFPHHQIIFTSSASVESQLL